MSTQARGSGAGLPRVRVWESLLLFASVSLSMGCAKRWDGTPQIEVSPGAARRMALLERARAEAPKPSVPAVFAERLTPARAPTGSSATGAVGDWLLGNGEIVVVLSRGALIDAADARARTDELGRFEPAASLGAACDEGRGVADEKRATVTFTCAREGARVETEYALVAGDRAVLVTTSVIAGDADVSLPAIEDRITWGALRPFAPGRPAPLDGDLSGPYVGGVGAQTSLAFTSTEATVEGATQRDVTTLRALPPVALPAGKRTQCARVVVLGERPDTASLVTELTRASGGEVGTLVVKFTSEGGAPARAPRATAISLSLSREGDEVLRVVSPREGAEVSAAVPPGRYYAWTEGTPRQRVEVRAAAEALVRLSPPRPVTPRAE